MAEFREQRPHRAVRAEAVGRQLFGQVPPERVQGHGKRDRALVLDAAPVQHHHPGGPRVVADLRHQGGLAEPGLAHQGEHAARSLPHVVDRAPRRCELALASQQLHVRPDGTRAPRIPRGGGSAGDSPAMTGHEASVPPGMNPIKTVRRISPLAIIFIALAAAAGTGFIGTRPERPGGSAASRLSDVARMRRQGQHVGEVVVAPDDEPDFTQRWKTVTVGLVHVPLEPVRLQPPA